MWNVCFTISSLVTDWYFCWKSNISGAWTMIWYQRRFMGGLGFTILCLMFWDRVLTLWSPSPPLPWGYHTTALARVYSLASFLWAESVLPSTCWVTNHRQVTSLWVSLLTRCMWLLSVPCHEVLTLNYHMSVLGRLLDYQKVLAATIDIIMHWIFVVVLDSLAMNSLCRPDAASASSVLGIKTPPCPTFVV